MDKLFAFLKLVRFPNLVMLVLVQVITVICFYPSFSLKWSIAISFTTILIAAGGYVINDIQDFELDKLNKNIITIFSKNDLIKTYKILIIISLISSVYISTLTSFDFIIWFLIPIIVLWLYAYFFSKYKLIGNIIISLLVAESILIIIFFLNYHQDFLPNSNYTLLQYSLLAFWFNYIREIVKDIEDIEGDNAFERKTIPILFGLNKTKIYVAILFKIALIFIWFSGFYISFIWLKVIFTILISIVLFLLFKAKQKQDFKNLSLQIKLIMLLGLLSPLLFYFS